MIITKNGITIRMSVNGLRVMGRATQGVKVIKLGEDDDIASVAKIEESVLAAEGQTENGEDLVIESPVAEADGTTETTTETPNTENPASDDDQNNPETPNENTDI